MANNIDFLSKTLTTGQIIKHYRSQPFGVVKLDRDLLSCERGNREAIEDDLGGNTAAYHSLEFMEVTNEEEILRGMGSV